MFVDNNFKGLTILLLFSARIKNKPKDEDKVSQIRLIQSQICIFKALKSYILSFI